MVLLLGQHSGYLTVMLTYWVREGRWAGGGSERQDMVLLLRSHLFRVHMSTTLGAPTWNGHMPDKDRVEEAGHRQQHVGEELLEAAQPVGLLLCSMCQRPWLTPGGAWGEFSIIRLVEIIPPKSKLYRREAGAEPCGICDRCSGS